MGKIFFTLIFFVGLYAGAEQMQDSASQPDPLSKTDASVSQMSKVAVDKPKRNGFVSSTFGIVSPNFDGFVFVVETSYGEVVGKTDIADAGTFEATTSIVGVFSDGNTAVAVNGTTEINFIKNDGMNKMVPGLGIVISVGHVGTSSARGFFTSIGGELYLKAFVSKQFALVPYFGVEYVHGGASSDLGSVSVSGDGLVLNLGVGLRRYF